MTSPLHSRAEVGLAPPRNTSRLIRPAHLTAHYAGPSPWRGKAPNHARCATIWRGYQAFHTGARGWSDIAYTSGVCPHGHRYEGRGPGVRTAANGTNAGNAASYATCYIAGVGDPLTDVAKAAYHDEAQRLGVPLNRAHSDWKPTACPGDPLRDWVHGGAASPHATPPRPVEVPTDIAIKRWAKARQARAVELLPASLKWGDLPTISRGDRGLQVVHLQRVLNIVSGAQLTEDGAYGPSTMEAVRNIQRFFALAVDGVTGPPVKFTLAASLRLIAEGKA